ncbi:Proline racemase family protein [Sulfidibacter corallicola]
MNNGGFMNRSFDQRLADLAQWRPSGDVLTITCVDAHTGGEPLRVVLAGFPEVPGLDILAKRRYAREHLDHLRTMLMYEPRGHADMYGCLITPPVRPDSHFGVLFLHNEGFSTMCGHGIIAVTKVVLDMGLFPPDTGPLHIDTPAGLVIAEASLRNGNVDSVSFQNVPSFVVALDCRVKVPGWGEVTYDLAFGGAFYAYVDAASLGLSLSSVESAALIQAGRAVKKAVTEAGPIQHPFEDDLGFLYGTIFSGRPQSSEADLRNVCIFAEGEVDRSPTGTGVSGRMAIAHARGQVRVGESLVVESIVGSKFQGTVIEETKVGTYLGIVPQVRGEAFITGIHHFFADPGDPFKSGFFLR